MRRLWILCVSLSAVHLAIVVWGATGYLPRQREGPWGSSLHSYAMMSGADAQYGFYAPNVGTYWRTRFDLRDEPGRTWSDSFDTARSREARLRLEGADLPFMNGDAEKSPELRHHVEKSMAAAMFNRHPSAVSVTVFVEVFDVPSMADCRAGKRPRWNLIYEANVQRNASGDRERNVP